MDTKTISIYIHIPFCKTICVYCGFLTFANKTGFIPQYLKALDREIGEKARAFKKRRVVSVYFGGGTPSILKASQTEEILKSIRKNFKILKKPEITIECNPESVNPEKLAHFRQMGINRISLGMQSLNDKCLWRIARFHDKKTAIEAVKSIKKAGFTKFGLDFIIGLPYQTLSSFKKELKQILKLSPPHLSYYFLSRDTEKIELILRDCPDESVQIAMYNHLVKTLKDNDYVHYEVSNYAKPGFECRHNLRYWNKQEYLGLGLGAHSYVNRRCTENENNFEKYLKNPSTIADRVILDKETDRLDYIMLHLRTHEGIDLKDYGKKYGGALKILENSKQFIKTGRLIHKNNRIKPTEKGFLMLDGITAELQR